jgi:hypothetical protein
VNNYKPYTFWTKAELATHLKNLVFKLDMGKEVNVLIEEAMTSNLWNPTMDYDGCSFVQDVYHPCVSCFIHDYLWRTGQGGKKSDEIFYYLMLEEGIYKNRAKRRWLAVRIGWVFYYKWIHIKKRNLNAYSGNLLYALYTLRHRYARKN